MRVAIDGVSVINPASDIDRWLSLPIASIRKVRQRPKPHVRALVMEERVPSPWQRGTNENTNLLLRQYFPRGTDLSGYSQAQLDRVALRLNQRPRKTLGFQTPASKLQASVASTI
jgi:hypothetical protein